jgi:hypothetical protein
MSIYTIKWISTFEGEPKVALDSQNLAEASTLHINDNPGVDQYNRGCAS